MIDGGKHIDELVHPTTEQLKFAKDLHFIKIELLPTGIAFRELGLGGVVVLLVAFLQLEALSQLSNKLGNVSIPQLIAGPTARYPVRTIGNHLIGDAAKESSHPLGGVVIPSNGLDHLDGIEQGGQ